MKIYMLWVTIALLVLSDSSLAARRIEIVKDGNVKLPVDVSSINCSPGAAGTLFIQTLRSDLKRSGWFSVSQPGKGVVKLSGSFSGSGSYSTFNGAAHNSGTGRSYFSRTYNDKASKVRSMAHSFADDIVESVKNVDGIASTKIVMIGSRDGEKDIYMCDYDGANLLKITREGAVCLSPSWGPEGKTIVYTSFMSGFPDVYKIDLSNLSRRKVAGYAGLNAGADISPDGRSMALVLSKDGNPDLYVMNLRNSKLGRLTRTQYAAEASPAWSPDGNRIVFVSDKTRSPHLYVASRSGGAEKRLTFAGSQNVGPDWGASGKIVYSSRRGAHYQIFVTDPSTGETLEVTNDNADYEDPSWAPDGRHIVCSRTVGYQSELYILDTLGDPPLRLTQHQGEWYAPSWSPK